MFEECYFGNVDFFHVHRLTSNSFNFESDLSKKQSSWLQFFIEFVFSNSEF